jgi:hypothetical protein
MPSEPNPGPIDLNILPPQYRPRVVSPIFRFIWIVAVALVVGAIPLWALALKGKGDVRDLRTSVAGAQRTLVALRTPAADVISLTEQISTSLQTLEALQMAHGQAIGGRKDWPIVLTSLLGYDAARLRPLELHQELDDLTLIGLALDRDDVLTYASALDRSGVFRQVSIQSLQTSSEPFYPPIPSPAATVTPTHTTTPTATTPTVAPSPTKQLYDDYEIDDFDPKPISIGETQRRNFNPIYDVDTVAFLGKAGRRYCILAVPQNYGVDTFLEATVGTAHQANDDCRPDDQTLLSCRCPSAEGFGGLASLIEVQVPLPRDVQVRLRVSNRDQYGPEQWYTLQVIEIAGDAWERDDLVPKPIGVGKVQERTFYPYGDIDRVFFPVKAGRAYEVRTADLATGVDSVITVFLGGKVVTNDDVASGDPSSRVEFHATLDETASVNITNKGLYGIDMSYKIEVREVGGDAFEPDDFSPRPISPYEQQRHTFYPEGDVDRVEFNVKAGQTYEVKTYNLAVGVDTELTVVVRGQPYYNDDVAPGDQSSKVVFTATRDGRASVTISNREQFGPENEYWLTFTPGIVIPTITPTPMITPTPDLCRDAYEPDDSVGRLIVVGETQERKFCPAGDVDRAVFTAKPGYAYDIETLDLALGVDTQLTVQIGATIFSNDDRAPQDKSSKVHLLNTTTAEQPVFITIRNKELYGITQGYKLRVTGLGVNDIYEPDDIQGAPIAFGAPQARTFFPAGDIDRVYFTAKDGHRYRVRTDSAAPGVDTVLEVTMAAFSWSNDDTYSGVLTSTVEVQNDTGVEQTVRVKVTNKGQFHAEATYSLRVDDLGAISGDIYEPDETIKRYLSVGEGQRHTFHPQGDWDRVFVQVKAGLAYAIFTCGNPVAPNQIVDPVTPLDDASLQCQPLMPGVDTELVASGAPLPPGCATCTNDDALPGTTYRNSRIDFTAVADGEVAVTIYNRGLYGPDKQYYVRAANVVSCPPQDAYEPDDATPVPITPGVAQERSFSPMGDVDRVWFSAQPGRAYRIFTRDLSSPVDTVLYVTMGAYYWQNDDVVPGDRSSSVYIQNPAAVSQVVEVRVSNKGTYHPCARYYVQVDDLGTASNDGFRLSQERQAVALAPPKQATPTVAELTGSRSGARTVLNLSAVLPAKSLLQPHWQDAAPAGGVVRFVLVLKMKAVTP